MKITNVNIDNDGTAQVFVSTRCKDETLGNIFLMIDGYTAFTGWDLTDKGFMFNLDFSLCFDLSDFDTKKEYREVMIMEANDALDFIKDKYSDLKRYGGIGNYFDDVNALNFQM